MTKVKFIALALAMSMAALVEGQEITFTKLPSLPSAAGAVSFLRSTTGGLILDTQTPTGSLMYTFTGGVWQIVPGTGAEAPEPKALLNGSIWLDFATAVGNSLYRTSANRWEDAGITKMVTYSQKVDTSIHDMCIDDPFIWNKLNRTGLMTFRGGFPSNTGQVYYAGFQYPDVVPESQRRGIFVLTSTTPSGPCGFSKVFTLDANYEVLQLGRLSDGNFLAERFPLAPKTLETEIVRLSPTGQATILISSSHPAQVQVQSCCSLTFDPNQSAGLVSYLGLDGKFHTNLVSATGMKEVYTSQPGGLQFSMQPLSLSGAYAVIAGGQASIALDSLVLVNTETGKFKLVYSPAIVVGNMPRQSVNEFWVSLDTARNDGTFYLGLLSGNVKSIFQAEIGKLPTPILDPIPASVEPGSKIILSGKNLSVSGTTTIVLLNGKEVAANVSGDSISLTAPATEATYNLSVRLVGSLLSAECSPMNLMVVAPGVVKPVERASATVLTLGQSAQTVTFTSIGGNASGQGQSTVSWGACAFDGTNTKCTVSGPFTGIAGGGTYSFVLTYPGNGTSPLIAISSVPGGDFIFFNLRAGSFVTSFTTIDGTAITFYDPTFNFLFSNPTCTGVTPCAVGREGLTAGSTIAGPITGTFDATPAIRPDLGVISLSEYGAFPAIAPGTWIEIYGVNLSTTLRRVWSGSDFTGVQAPTSLGGTTVTIGGQPAYVYFVTPEQLDVQVPTGIGTGLQSVVVTTVGGTSLPSAITVNAVEPGLLAPGAFKLAAGQYATALFSNGTFVLPPGAVPGAASARAKAGDTIMLFGIGFGPVTPDIPAGRIVQQSNNLQANVQFSFAGVPASLQFAGLVANFVGLYQFNVIVPSGVPASDAVPVTFTVNGTKAPQTLLLPVQ